MYPTIAVSREKTKNQIAAQSMILDISAVNLMLESGKILRELLLLSLPQDNRKLKF